MYYSGLFESHFQVGACLDCFELGIASLGSFYSFNALFPGKAKVNNHNAPLELLLIEMRHCLRRVHKFCHPKCPPRMGIVEGAAQVVLHIKNLQPLAVLTML